MFYGIIQEDLSHDLANELLGRMGQIGGDSPAIQILPNFAVAFEPSNKTACYEDKPSGIQVCFHGTLFNGHEIEEMLRQAEHNREFRSNAELIFRSYAAFQREGLKHLNGAFLLVIHDPQFGTFIARDQIGLEPLYYYWQAGRLLFADSPRFILNYPDVRREIEPMALYRYLLFNYIPGEISIYKDIRKLRAGHVLSVSEGRLSRHAYWRLSFADVSSRSEAEISEELLARMREAVRIRLGADDKSAGVLLSGGMDSSTVVQLMRPMTEQTIHSFSFRCQGKSFDESRYAQIIADACHTEHHLVEYGPESVLLIDEMVGQMDEPFCDIGIEIATHLLGRQLDNRAQIVFTGDGGDELFAGHPVYLADRTAAQFDRLPEFIQNPITALCRLLPDSDSKKNLLIKAKRFAYSAQFPKALHSNRWRIYYKPDEISGLATPAFKAQIGGLDPLGEIRDLYREADGRDALSTTLYGDYHTVVEFYLARLRLLRQFGVEGRCPLLDPGLASFAATIPSELKIKNGQQTKYILHRTMEGILPDAIVHRKVKLGHSVPFKNWIRDSETVQGLIREVLSERSIRSRGMFEAPVIQTMLEQHLKKTHNHSHRLWALVVLELWMQKQGISG